jgi:hypothetical protein
MKIKNSIQVKRDSFFHKSIFIVISFRELLKDLEKTTFSKMLEQIFNGEKTRFRNVLERSYQCRGDRTAYELAIYASYLLGLNLSSVEIISDSASPHTFIRNEVEIGYQSAVTWVTETPITNKNVEYVVSFDSDRNMNHYITIKKNKIVLKRLS